MFKARLGERRNFRFAYLVWAGGCFLGFLFSRSISDVLVVLWGCYVLYFLAKALRMRREA